GDFAARYFNNWPRSSPAGWAAVWMFTYHMPASISRTCWSVRVASPEKEEPGLGMVTWTPAFLLASAGPWKCAMVGAAVRLDRLPFQDSFLVAGSKVAVTCPLPARLSGGTSLLPFSSARR